MKVFVLFDLLRLYTLRDRNNTVALTNCSDEKRRNIPSMNIRLIETANFQKVADLRVIDGYNAEYAIV